MTYSYNEYGCNKSYYGLHMAKWVVYDCDQSMFLDCIDKKLTLANIFFDRYFNQPVEAIHHFTSFSKLLLVAILIDPLKPLPTVRTFDKSHLAGSSINPLPTVQPFDKLLSVIIQNSVNSLKPFQNT